MASSGLPAVRSPASPRSGATSPRPKFDSDQLQPYIKKLLSSTLQNVTWTDFKEKERRGALIKEIGARVKERMLGAHVLLPPDVQDWSPKRYTEIEPRGL
jgi:tctex1 domain-containing protein 2